MAEKHRVNDSEIVVQNLLYEDPAYTYAEMAKRVLCHRGRTGKVSQSKRCIFIESRFIRFTTRFRDGGPERYEKVNPD